MSNLGNVRSLKREWKQKHYSGKESHYVKNGRTLKPQKQKNGYLIIDLHYNKHSYRKLIHKLVADAFLNNHNNYKYINHKDNNPQNNRVDNLEWCSQSYNIKYAYEKGNKIPPNMKKVAQIDIQNGEVIRTYNSISEASRETKINNISMCCRKLRNKAGGYKWKYV